MAPAADKWLQPDGSVTTTAGDVILSSDPERAKDYIARMPNAAKWLLPGGEIVSELPGSGGGIIVGDEEIGVISNLKISQIIHQVFGGN